VRPQRPPEATDVPDVATVEVPLGARVVVAAELLLGRTATPSSEVATAELATVLDAWEGPGAVIFAGGLLDLLGDARNTPAAAFGVHRRLATAVREFAAPEGRRVVCIPGARDARLAWDAGLQRELAKELDAEIALAVDLEVATSEHCRAVRIESGSRFDERFALREPRSPVDTPLGHHLVTDVLPNLDERWAAGADRVDAALLPRFVASRLLYRRLGRFWWLLLLPFLVALAVKLPLSFAFAGRLDRALGPWDHRLLVLGLTTLVDLVVVVPLLAAAVTAGWRTIVGLSVTPAERNEAARNEARRIVAGGGAGLVVGHARSPELTDLGAGFFANVGLAAEVVTEREGRGWLPPVFAPERVVSWIEIEAGAGLHVHLFRSRVDVGGASGVERVAARRLPSAPRPVLVASWPKGDSYPAVESALRPRVRVRRRAAGAIAIAGLLDIVSALTPPIEARLRHVLDVVPLAVPQAAAAVVALSGVALLVLSRGLRRGQRDSWLIAVGVLVASALLHLVKGADVEEAVAAVAVTAYLLVHRRDFGTRRRQGGVVRSLLAAVAGLASVVVAATALVELLTALRHERLPIGSAVVAVTQRLAGVRTIKLPDRLDDFSSPVLLALGIGFAAWIGWTLVRPAATRPRAADSVARAREIVKAWGAGTLDYFALRDDKELFFSGSTLVAYAVHHGVCLVSPDPIGPRWERDAVWEAFRQFADEHGWAVAILGAGDDWLPTYRASGMHDLYVGDEAVVDLNRFTLEGGRQKSLRQAVNRIARNGYSVTFHDPAIVDPELQKQLRAVMTSSRRGDVERGFSMTLGRIFSPDDADLLLAVCHGPDGTPVAFCQYVPAPGIEGYSLDLMRRDAGEHPNGVLDFVIAETITHLRERGLRRLGLNFATMRAILAGETGAGITAQVERWALRRMSGSMQIESLWKFNAKFDPEWLPRYVVFDSPEHAVAVALAVARAESFWELPVIGRFLVPKTATPE
jgi:lysylphosphatidylglycerol synthetase-like protein (DUF2156 family)